MFEAGINNVILLEAEDRIGGRIHTVPFGDNHVDFEAQWCHGKENNIVYEIVDGEAEDVRSETDANFGKMSFMRSDGTRVDGRHCENLMNLCKYLYSGKFHKKIGKLSRFHRKFPCSKVSRSY